MHSRRHRRRTSSPSLNDEVVVVPVAVIKGRRQTLSLKDIVAVVVEGRCRLRHHHCQPFLISIFVTAIYPLSDVKKSE